jgi:NAD(P)-dependent dehydrogenase (short-subunit alcohol dehydrogenase family)
MAPGTTATSMWQAVKDVVFVSMTNPGRVRQPSEVANIALDLLSPEVPIIKGAAFAVDGGRPAPWFRCDLRFGRLSDRRGNGESLSG